MKVQKIKLKTNVINPQAFLDSNRIHNANKRRAICNNRIYRLVITYLGEKRNYSHHKL